MRDTEKQDLNGLCLGKMVGIDENVDKFCRECGQAIDENLEGMEDE